jgi:hypothetical protein
MLHLFDEHALLFEHFPNSLFNKLFCLILKCGQIIFLYLQSLNYFSET